MDLDTLHNWLMFRPLLVFILACPFLVLPLVVSWWKDRQAAKRARKAKANRAPVVAGVPHAVGPPDLHARTFRIYEILTRGHLFSRVD